MNAQREGVVVYKSTLSLTLAVDGVDGQGHAPAVLLWGKRPGTLFTGGWVGRSGRVQISPPPPQGFDPRTTATLFRPAHLCIIVNK